MDLRSAINRRFSYLLRILKTHFCLASSPLTSPTIPPMVTARNTTILFLTLFMARSFYNEHDSDYKTIFLCQKLYQTLKKPCPFRGIFFDLALSHMVAYAENGFYEILM